MALEEVIRQRAAPGAGGQRVQWLLGRVRESLLAAGQGLDLTSPRARERLHDLAWRLIEAEAERTPHWLPTAVEKAAVLDGVLAGIFGLGILEPLLRDPAVTEIMVNGPERILVERGGVIEPARDAQGRPLRFAGRQELLHLIERMVSPLNRRVDESDPIVDARLPDGSRVNVVLQPVALTGPVVTIRTFPAAPWSLADLVRTGTLGPGLAALLTQFMAARCNLVVSGGTGTGKTTFLNALGMLIAPLERVVTVEDAAELKLVHLENLVALETRPPNLEGKGAITARDLVRTALRMRPDRILVGEVRGGEALDMLQAMNTGHDGSLTTAHANSAQDLIGRLETMTLMAGVDLPLPAVRRQIAGAVDFIVHLARMPAGRRVVQVTEILGYEGGEVALRDLLTWDPDAGRLAWTGQPLTRTGKFRRAGLPVPDPGAGEVG